MQRGEAKVTVPETGVVDLERNDRNEPTYFRKQVEADGSCGWWVCRAKDASFPEGCIQTEPHDYMRII